MYSYAQLNDNEIVVGVSLLSGEVSFEHMIPLPTYDLTVLGKKYNRDIGEFE